MLKPAIKKSLGFTVVFLLAAGLFMISTKQALAAYLPPDSGGNGVGGISPALDSAQNYSGNIAGGNFDSTFSSKGTPETPYLDVGNNDNDYTYSSNETRVYVKTGTSVQITIDNAYSDCHTASGGGVVGPDYTTNGASPTIQYTILGAGNTSLATKVVTAGGCNSYPFSSISVSKSNAYSITPTANGDYDGYFIVSAAVQKTSVGQGENSYQIEVDTSNAVVGAGSTVFGIGYRDGNLNDFDSGTPYLWSSWVNFALPLGCSNLGDNSTQAGSVTVKDPDGSRHDWNTGMIYEIQSQSIDNNNNTGNWTTIDSTVRQQSAGQIGDGDVTMSFSADYNHRYRVVVGNVGVRNTLRLVISSNFSTLYSKLSERPTSSICGGTVSCTTNPSSEIKIPNGSSADIAVTIKISGGSLPGTYYIKRVGPSYKTIPFDSGSSVTGTDHITPGNNLNQQPYVYTIYDSKTNNAVPGAQSCSVPVTTSPGAGPISCTASPPQTVNVNFGATIHVTVYNNSSSNLQGGQLRQTSPGGGAWPASGFGNFSKGQNASHDFSILARSSPQTVTFEYTLFKNTGGGSPVFPGTTNPLCKTTITWRKPGVPIISASCTDVHITGAKSTATYQRQVSYVPGEANVNVASVQLGPVSGELAVKTPPPGGGGGGGGGSGGGGGGGGPTYVATTISKIPIKIVMSGPGGFSQTVSGAGGNFWLPNDGTTTRDYDTYNTFSQAWPHNGYHLDLYYVADGASQANSDDGNYYANENWTLASSTDLGPCLTVNVDTVCVGPSTDSGPVEPGQRYTFTYKIQLNNMTDKQFSASDPNGYNIYASTDWPTGGLKPDYSNPISAGNIAPGPGTVTITGQIPVIVEYSGHFWVDFRFKGSTLGLDGWDGDCGNPTDTNTPGQPGSDTPETRPYLQVWNGDATAGGGFANPDGTCNVSLPGYVSPATAGGNPDAPYYGGIRTFGDPAGQRGSLSDFGVIALGQIPLGTGSTGQQVIGFSSKHNVIFANNGVPGLGSSSVGGYLNSSSSNHCVEDFFTNTRSNSVSHVAAFPAATGQYSMDDGSTIGAENIGHNQITIYVAGNVTIDGNITYPASYNPNTPSDVPYFALIVQGNITLTGNVTELDGLYVAQPDTSGNGGIFATCDTSNPCNSQLVVNGAVIAQHAEPLRNHGTLGPLNDDVNGLGDNPAEIFNYVPSMVLGAPEFQAERPTLESLFSLPPVF